MTNPRIRAFFDEPTNTVSYLVWDPESSHGAVIDPVLDFDLASGEADVRSAEAILAAAEEEGVTVDRVLETHAHADHLSAAPFIKAKTGATIGIGAHIRDVQKIFRPVFGLDDLKTDGSDFDDLFEDGETFTIGSLNVEVLHVPGHTPADVAYKIEDAVFVVDTQKEKIAVDEARKLKIPVIGIVDTNCDPDDVDYVIPGNDDALRSLRLFLSRIADAAIAGRGLRDAAQNTTPEASADSANAASAEPEKPEPAPTPASV